jgi:hypothetical protein
MKYNYKNAKKKMPPKKRQDSEKCVAVVLGYAYGPALI